MNRDIAVYSDDGIKLAAVLYTPEAAKGPVPGVVICQGFGSTKEINLPPIAEMLADAGYAALIFDYRGFGKSGGTPWRLIPEEQVADIRACISFLEGEDGVDPTRLGTVGVSFGGSNAIQAAGLDSRIRATVAAVAFGDGARWLRDMRPFWQFRQLRDKIARDRVQR
ncbi:MAG: alpha/beta hydrolase, partial [Planctomycetaceae bacterium]